MINKENNKDNDKKEHRPEAGIIDIATMDVQCHILIKDKDTGEVLLNRRG